MTLTNMQAARFCSVIGLSLSINHGVGAFAPGISSNRNNRAFLLQRQSPSPCSASSSSATALCATPTEEQSNSPAVEEEISDIDARVLQSMLQDGALDLETEDDMKKLLERGVAPKDARLQDLGDESDSEFSSRVVQTLTDTKLWKALQAKADDVMESASIYVSNRIERDSKLLASIGVFAWERAKRDVARALPASSGATVGRVVRTATKQLGSSRSVDDVKEAFKASAASVKGAEKERTLEDVNLYEEFNTPFDEIRSVTKSIRDILSGESVSTTTTAQRGLRSTAPAGEKTRTERQQRAYQKRKQTVLKREKEGVNVGRVTGGFVDAAWEVKQDISVETNRPGYKTKGIRTAIAAGAETTSRVIAAAREGQPGAWKNILFGSKEKVQVFELESEIESAAEPLQEMPELPELPVVPPEPELVADVPLPAELLDEQRSVVSRLKFCIEKPEETWLTTDVLATLEDTIDPDELRDVVTTMICARDDLSITSNQPETILELITKLKQVKNTIEMVNSKAGSVAGPAVASKLGSILYGSDPEDAIQPTLMALDEIKIAYDKDMLAREVAQANYDAAIAERQRLVLEWERVFDEREDLIEQAKIRAQQILAEEERIAAEQAAIAAKRFAAQQAAADRADAERAAAARAADIEREATVITQPKSVITDEPIAGDGSILDALVVDVFDASFEKSSTAPQWTPSSGASAVDVIVDDDPFQSMASEVLGDTDDVDFSEGRYRTVLEEEEEVEEEPNPLVDGALRAADVVFAVTEKAIFSGIPGVFNAAGVASKRMDAASRGGLGKIGWTRIDNTERGAKRY